MANISGLLGTAGGFKGTGVDAPEDWVDPSKLDAAQGRVTTAMQDQNSLLAALQGQNGLANQSSVYNQYQNVANGTGPNPAQAQLAQATAANTANQAALMAGQRGTSANAGLLARQAAMQGGNNQQQAAGQAATLQAQQSLAALGQMGGLANTQTANQIGQTNANQQAAQSNQNAMLTGNANQNAIRQSLITATAQQQASGLGSGVNAAGSAMSSFGGSSGSAAAAKGGNVEDLPKMANGGSLLAGIFKLASMADGGDPGQAFADPFKGQPISDVQRIDPGPNPTWGDQQLANSGKFSRPKPKSAPGQFMSGSQPAQTVAPDMKSDSPDSPGMTDSPDSPYAIQPDNEGTAAMAKGGKVPALVSPGEQYIPPKDVKKVEKGANPLAVGERIPGNPKYPGNDYRNDTVPKTLESGGIVIPNKIMQAKNPHFEAMKFVHAHIAKHRKTLPSRKK